MTHRRVTTKTTTWAESQVIVEHIASAMLIDVDGNYTGKDLGWPKDEFYNVTVRKAGEERHQPVQFEAHEARELKKILGSFGL